MAHNPGQLMSYIVNAALSALEEGRPMPQTYEIARGAETSKKSVRDAICRLKSSGKIYLGVDRKILEVRI